MDAKTFRQLTRPHQRAIRQLLLDFEFFVEDVGGLLTYSIESRLKSFESASQKAVRHEVPIENLSDLGGLRLVVATANDVEVVRSFLKRQETGKNLRIIREESIAREDGYRSLHVDVAYCRLFSPAAYEPKIEVQVATIFQHAFNFVSRAWAYKSNNAYSSDWTERFVKASELLATLDPAMASLHGEAVQAAIGSSGQHPLTPLAYVQLVREVWGEQVSIDTAVFWCNWLADQQLTVATLRAFFERADIEAMWRSWVTAGDQGIEVARGFAANRQSFWFRLGTRPAEAQEILDKLTRAPRTP